MNELFVDLWSAPADCRVVTTNGFRKADGSCVMGRGCALEAKGRWPWLPARLGQYLSRFGNRAFRLARASELGGDFDLASFPVKPERGVDGKPGWACEAEPELILRSARELVLMADKFGWRRVLVPRPGCGNGRLKWPAVRELLAPVLDDRFSIVHKPKP